MIDDDTRLKCLKIDAAFADTGFEPKRFKLGDHLLRLDIFKPRDPDIPYE